MASLPGRGPHYSLAWGQLPGTGYRVAVSLPSSSVFQAFISFFFLFFFNFLPIALLYFHFVLLGRN